MKNIYKLLSLLLLFLFVQITKTPFVQGETSDLPTIGITSKSKKSSSVEKNYREGEVLIEYEDQTKLEQKIEKINDGETKKDSTKIEKDIEGANIALLKSENKKTADLIAELEEDDNVKKVEPNYFRELSFSPNDTYFDPYQWAFLNTGQTINEVSGTTDADIDLTEAWDIEEDDATQTIVAVIDSGVLYTHTDLVANMWDGTTCVDEDNSSIADGCPNHGWDFENNDNDPDDETGHGTHVSSIIGNTTDNSTGIAGMSRYNNLRIMAVRFGMDVYTEINAINFANNNGAKVINGSFSGTGYSSLEKDAIDNFDGIFVAAAGNGGNDGVSDDNDTLHQYPCDYSSDNIVCVAASNQNDELADFSNYSTSSVDLAAPGVAIAGIENYPDIDYDSGYVLGDGTSFAAPMVAGTVGLLYAHNQTASISTIKDSLLKSSDHLTSLSGKTVCSRRLNTNNALTSIITNVIPSETYVNPVYRFYNKIYDRHFFTISESEKDFIEDDLSYWWDYEGISFYAYSTQETNTTPVYRFYNKIYDRHFFTISESEKDFIEDDLSYWWDYEGISFYAYSTQETNTTPVYRFYNKIYDRHFFTISESEKDFIEDDLSYWWDYEGISFYTPQ